jgi:hypothetical protein
MAWPGTLLPWLKKAFFEKKDNDGALSRLELRQVVHGSADTVVETWNYNEDTPKANIDELASEIAQRAQSDCDETFDGPTQYTVLSFHGGTDFPSGRSPGARMLSRTRSTGDIEETEPPTTKGFAAQQMRHNEALFRISMVNTEHQRQHDRKLLEMYQHRMEQLEERHFTSLHFIEEMLSERVKREIEGMEAKEGMVRKREAWNSAKILFPTVVNKLAGKTVMPVTTTPETEIARRLMESLTPEQVAKLQPILTTEQIIGLGQLYELAHTENEKQEAEDKKKIESVVIKDVDKDAPIGARRGPEKAPLPPAPPGGANGNGKH